MAMLVLVKAFALAQTPFLVFSIKEGPCPIAIKCCNRKIFQRLLLNALLISTSAVPPQV
jgi:hypothetical protein